MEAMLEEQQASNEELKSTNEELQSTNEELQSTNEELETSKEELQSVNEELVTVNSELQTKIEQLTGMQDDMKNLLDNIRVGTIFLDRRLLIRRFTRDATKVYRLVPTDVGRPLADIRCELREVDLLTDAQDGARHAGADRARGRVGRRHLVPRPHPALPHAGQRDRRRGADLRRRDRARQGPGRPQGARPGRSGGQCRARPAAGAGWTAPGAVSQPGLLQRLRGQRGRHHRAGLLPDRPPAVGLPRDAHRARSRPAAGTQRWSRAP